jgi:hypothetical protein
MELEKLSTHVSIAISLCKSGSKRISSSNGLEVGKSAPEVRAIRWVRKDVRHAVSMRTVRCSDFTAEHEVRYTGNEFHGYHNVQDIGSTRRVVCVGGWGIRSQDQIGDLVGIITWDIRPLVFSREV